MGAESEAGLRQQLVDCIRMLAQSDIIDYLEENAYRQYMALQIGKPYAFTEQEVALCREKLWTQSLFKRTWDHFRAKLE